MQKHCFKLTSYTANDTTVYGIEIETENGDIYKYENISASADETKALITRMDDADISPIHFEDIILDYITELYYKKLKTNGLA